MDLFMKKLLLLCCVAISFQTHSMLRKTIVTFVQKSGLEEAVTFLQKSGFKSHQQSVNEIIFDKDILLKERKQISILYQTSPKKELNFFNVFYTQTLWKTIKLPTNSKGSRNLILEPISKTEIRYITSTTELMEFLKKITKNT